MEQITFEQLQAVYDKLKPSYVPEVQMVPNWFLPEDRILEYKDNNSTRYVMHPTVLCQVVGIKCGFHEALDVLRILLHREIDDRFNAHRKYSLFKETGHLTITK